MQLIMKIFFQCQFFEGRYGWKTCNLLSDDLRRLYPIAVAFNDTDQFI